MGHARSLLLGAVIVPALVFPAALGAQRSNVRFDRLSLEHGLSQSSVHAICQDSVGFMWFGTDDGLNRYDGTGFQVKRNDPDDPESLSSNSIRAIAEDRTGTLWIGTWIGGLERYDRRQDSFSHYRHDPDDPSSLTGDTILSIYEDRAGTLWIGTAGGGLEVYDRSRDAFVHLGHDPQDSRSIGNHDVLSIIEDRSGRFWIGTGGGLYEIDRDLGVVGHYQSGPEESSGPSAALVFSVHEDRAGGLWVGTAHGLARVATDRVATDRVDRAHKDLLQVARDPTYPESLKGGIVRSIYEDRSGELWIGTEGGGLHRFDRRTERFIDYPHKPSDPASISSNSILSFYEDRSGVLWIGTDGGGLSKLITGHEGFVHYRHQPGVAGSLSDDMVFSFSEDHLGALWVGTLEGGLNRLDRERQSFRVYRHDPEEPGSLGNDMVYAIHQDRAGVLWVATQGAGLNRYRRAEDNFEQLRHDPGDPDSLSSDWVFSLYEDRSGALWVGTYDAGVDKLDRRRQVFAHYRHDPSDPASLGAGAVYAITGDRSDAVWIGTEAGGLSRYHPDTESFTRYRHDPDDAGSLSSDDVMAIHEDETGVLWVGTYGGGLNKLDSERSTFTHYREKEGLASDVIYGILEDDRGRLWLSTNQGLSRFDPASLELKSYGPADGLQNTEFNTGAFYKTRDGEMFFGGIYGIDAFYPERIGSNTHVPPVVLTSFKKLNQAVVLGTALTELDEIRLSHEDRVFSFELAALDFHAPGKNRYAYMLEGFDRDWIDLGAKRDVTFTNLDPGSYTFRARASNNHGVWNQTGLSVDLAITPPYWQTWWFRALAGGAVALLLVSAYQVRTRAITRRSRQLQAVNSELQREMAQRRRAEAEREGLISELEARNAELERFTYTVSHDLKTPLVTIKGFAGYLGRNLSSGDTARVASDLERINAAADRMHHLLDDLLELSQVGRVVRPSAEVPLEELFREAVELDAARIGEGGVEIEIAADLPVVFGDRLRLSEVVQNLIDNAIRFLGEEPKPRVEVATRRQDGQRVVTVRDNGIGIESRYLEKIFGLFERLDPDVQGTGIGLALAKRIVEFHGGRIWAESEGPGRGSTFCFFVPRAPPEPGSTESGKASRETSAP